MGQALYRKYRSKSLDEIVGQEHITLSLQHALKSGNISHAYLFTGPRGVGKTSIARILAYAANGLAYSDETEQHLDIIEIDAASHRRIDEIRDIREKVNITPTSAKYKVYIIDEVHMLTKEAFNALLKTLEEPPAHVIFILATTELHKVPETIISRTQRFNFRPVPKSQVVEHLKSIAKSEKIKIDDEALGLIAEHGNGTFRDSISLLDQIRNQTGSITVDNVLETIGLALLQVIDSLKTSIVNQDRMQLLRILSDVDNHGYDPAVIASQLGANLRSDIFDDHLVLSEKLSLKLLASLLNVPVSSNPGVALELALLGSIDLKAIAVNSAPPVVQKTTVEIQSIPKEPVKKKQVKDSAPATETEEVEESVDEYEHNPIEYNPSEAWPAVLEIIKKTHNTLYSVLRVAQPTWEEDKITIAFQFPFHQKRMSDRTNNDIISNAIKEVINKQIKVECIVDTTIVTTIEPAADDKIDEEESPLDNISNIFGSAELLES